MRSSKFTREDLSITGGEPDVRAARSGARTLVGGVRLAIAAVAAVGLLAIGVGAAGAKASTRDVDVRYRVSYGALPMGQLSANVSLAPSSYALKARFESGGLAKLMRSTKGTATASGALGKAGPQPKSFKLGYTSGKKKRARTIAFKGDTVAKAVESPKRKTPKKGWVPTKPAHLKGAVDPASAFLVQAANGNPCGAKLKVFDGRTRVDASMKSMGEVRFKAKGFKGKARKCAVSVAPVAGYRKSEAKRVGKLKGMTASFVPVPGTDLHVLVALEVPTPIGKFTAKATKLDLDG